MDSISSWFFLPWPGRSPYLLPENPGFEFHSDCSLYFSCDRHLLTQPPMFNSMLAKRTRTTHCNLEVFNICRNDYSSALTSQFIGFFSSREFSLVAPCALWDLCSPPGIEPRPSTVRVWSPHPTRESPPPVILPYSLFQPPLPGHAWTSPLSMTLLHLHASSEQTNLKFSLCSLPLSIPDTRLLQHH